MPVKHGKFYKMKNEEYAKNITSNTNSEAYELRLKRMNEFGDVKWWKFDENYSSGAKKIVFYQLNAPDVLLVTEDRLVKAFENTFSKEFLEETLQGDALNLIGIRDYLNEFTEEVIEVMENDEPFLNPVTFKETDYMEEIYDIVPDEEELERVGKAVAEEIDEIEL